MSELEKRMLDAVAELTIAICNEQKGKGSSIQSAAAAVAADAYCCLKKALDPFSNAKE